MVAPVLAPARSAPVREGRAITTIADPTQSARCPLWIGYRDYSSCRILMSGELKPAGRFGPYDLLQRIGRGGMATVWVARERAEQRADERIVAIKAILADLADDEEFTAMFLDEARLVQRIRHPNVVELYDVGQVDEQLYMAMEWVEGESLHTVIAEAGKRRPIPPEMAVRIIADAAAGLHAAHETRNDSGVLLGVVHRDVSPHNILIGTNGRVKLLDFGVAKAKERMAEATVAGQVKGKFGYMSPEQAVARPVDRRSDIFSLGIVLFELTTGRRLFRGEHDAETLSLVISGEIPPPRTIDPAYPESLQRIVMKALSRSRSGRFQTAREFQKALERYLRDERMVIARAGIAALLKRVVGDRIEDRRRQVRAMLKAMDGGEDPALVSNDSAFQPVDPEHFSSTSGLSDISAVAELAREDRISMLTDSESTVDQPPSSLTNAGTQQSVVSDRPRRAPSIGYVIGVVGLLIAALALGVYYARPLLPEASEPAARSVPADSPEAREAAAEGGASGDDSIDATGGGSASSEEDEMPTISVDKLETAR